MADTSLGDYPDKRCVCGALGCNYCHWGPLTDYEVTYMCESTWAEVQSYYNAHGKAMPVELITKKGLT